jgi:5-methylcytosine-specific restriction endonuclease McrA
LANELNVSKKTILNQLSSLPDWNELKQQLRSLQLEKKSQSRLVTNTCIQCNTAFTSSRKQKYCKQNCIKARYQKNINQEQKNIINARKRENRALKEKKLSLRQDWELKFLEKIKCCHQRNLDKVVKKILKKIDSVKNSLVSRSKKYNVECNITIEELRNLVYEQYGKKCKYCDKILKTDTMVFDHIIPISKGGSSNIENIQLICRTSNGMKGSLNEDSFRLLLDWLETVPKELQDDIRIRLSKGIH